MAQFMYNIQCVYLPLKKCINNYTISVLLFFNVLCVLLGLYEHG